MDTALAAFLLGVGRESRVVVAHRGAAPAQLADPTVLCIEAGGSGQAELNNFDHHDTPLPLAPACRQAFEVVSRRATLPEHLARVVDYVAGMDQGIPQGAPSHSTGIIPLAAVFSGMLLCTPDPVEQFHQGIALFHTVVAERLDPCALPERPEWRRWIEAKRQQRALLAQALSRAELFATGSGRRGGFVETELMGAIGGLFRLGCQIAVAYCPRFGPLGRVKYTIAGNGLRVDHLLPVLVALEPGWGGPAHGTILGSPREGSGVSPAVVKELVRRHL